MGRVIAFNLLVCNDEEIDSGIQLGRFKPEIKILAEFPKSWGDKNDFLHIMMFSLFFSVSLQISLKLAHHRNYRIALS